MSYNTSYQILSRISVEPFYPASGEDWARIFRLHKTVFKTDPLFRSINGIIRMLERVLTSHKNPITNENAGARKGDVSFVLAGRLFYKREKLILQTCWFLYSMDFNFFNKTAETFLKVIVYNMHS